MLKQRIITAAVLILLIFAAIFFLPPFVFFIMTSLVVLWGAWEWSGLLPLKHKGSRFSYVILVALLLPMAATFSIQIVLFLGVIFWLFALIWLLSYSTRYSFSDRLQHGFWRGFSGVCVLVPGWLAFSQLRLREGGIYWLVMLLLLVWITDSAAYFAGKKWGKKKLAPKISPKKTWAGFWAACIGVLCLAILELLRLPRPFDQAILWLVLVLSVWLMATIGDLFESLQKRISKQKDSGGILPGHGGLLDRIDGLLAAAPFYAWFLLQVGWTH